MIALPDRKKLLLTLSLMGLTHVLWASEQSLYNFLWLDPDKKVYVLQNKVYKKRATFYGSLGYLAGLKTTYQNTSGLQVALGAYFTEDWGIEFVLHSYKNEATEARKRLDNISDNAEAFLRNFEKKMGAMAIWSPFYGKINTF